jgi:hypothetical protein
MFGDGFEQSTILAVVFLALAGVSHAADSECDRGSTRSPTVRQRSGGGHANPLGVRIQAFQPWVMVSEPSAPRSAFSVLFGR